MASGHAALLLVDLQHDFLARDGLQPSADTLVATNGVLNSRRALLVPVTITVSSSLSDAEASDESRLPAEPSFVCA